ncbi:hypothetical protein N7534_003302 [Penicillium rubens]|nr:hypothetical protein N7534_003302 [Penicillium rubens]
MEGLHEPALWRKRKRTYRHSSCNTANKRSMCRSNIPCRLNANDLEEIAADTPTTSETAESDNPPAAVTTGSGSSTIQSPVSSPVASVAAASPVEEFSPKPTSSAGQSPSPSRVEGNHEEDTDNAQEGWDPVDPLGLFDELEGPLDWPSEGLFD